MSVNQRDSLKTSAARSSGDAAAERFGSWDRIPPKDNYANASGRSSRSCDRELQRQRCKNYNTMSSLVRLENANIFSSSLKK
jgi:hypothetical protein